MSTIRRQIAEARATTLVLRATARAYRGFDGALMCRLNRAADSLDSMVLLTMRSLKRVKRLRHDLCRLKGGAS